MDKKLPQRLGNDFSGPIIFSYVWWILREAQKRKWRTLYFLARDGYLLREVAQQFCLNFNLDIDCRYLYCSRASLRMPSYHLIGDEAYELLLLGGYHVTIQSLLQRAEFDEDKRTEIYGDCGLREGDEYRLLGRADLEKVRQCLKQSPVYRKYIQQSSEAAYKTAIGYLEQEGLFEQDTVALIDSGWTGSMQRSIRQLLRSKNYQGDLAGFYFGMYAKPKSPEDGIYQTWYFNHGSKVFNKIPFCNNLFECLLSAPHGMTTGYQFQNGKYIPNLLPPPDGEILECIKSNIDTVLNYTKKRLVGTVFESFNEQAYLQDTKKRIKRYMAHPRIEEAAYYGKFLFCDDITEAYHLQLAGEEQVQALKGYSLPARIWRRLFCRGNRAIQELLWPYGTIAFLPFWKRLWYRWNIYIWEWIRYGLH